MFIGEADEFEDCDKEEAERLDEDGPTDAADDKTHGGASEDSASDSQSDLEPAPPIYDALVDFDDSRFAYHPHTAQVRYVWASAGRA